MGPLSDYISSTSLLHSAFTGVIATSFKTGFLLVYSSHIHSGDPSVTLKKPSVTTHTRHFLLLLFLPCTCHSVLEWKSTSVPGHLHLLSLPPHCLLAHSSHSLIQSCYLFTQPSLTKKPLTLQSHFGSFTLLCFFLGTYQKPNKYIYYLIFIVFPTRMQVSQGQGPYLFCSWLYCSLLSLGSWKSLA